MGRICPILNHPLNDGVLINDDALVSFIQKRNVDFLAHEYVCRSCKREIEKLYKKKLKKATALLRSRYHDGSISTLKTSRDTSSSGSSTTSEHSVALNGAKRKRTAVEEITLNGKGSSISETSVRQKNVNEENINLGNISNRTISADIIAVSETSVQILATYTNERFALQENQQNLADNQQNTLANVGDKLAASIHKNVTIRKRTIKDFYTPKQQKSNEAAVAVKHQERAQTINQTEIRAVRDSELYNENDNDAVIRTSQEPTTSKAAAASNLYSSVTAKKKALTPHITYDSELDNGGEDDDVIRRLSQEPTTSRAAAAAAANSNKRPISAVIESDDEDDTALSLNAYNGTRLPHIQPLPPKRKSLSEKVSPIGRDIMDDYIKKITGG